MTQATQDLAIEGGSWGKNRPRRIEEIGSEVVELELLISYNTSTWE